MSEFSIKILGSSSALPTSIRSLSAHVLNVHGRFFLIDCGEATQIQLRKYRVSMTKINHIFISHLHGDHFYGLFGLISTLNLMGKNGTLHIHAHSDLKVLLNPFLEYFDNKLSFKVVFNQIQPNKNKIIFEDNGLTVETIPLKHRIPTCGFLFREKQKLRTIKKDMIIFHKIPVSKIQSIKEGEDFINNEGVIIDNTKLTEEPSKPRSYAYCSDTKYLEKVIPIIKGVDILYHEATFEKKDEKLAAKTYHSTSEQAALIAKHAEVSKLLIGHFSTRYKKIDKLLADAKNIFDNTIAVNDGDYFQIPYIPRR